MDPEAHRSEAPIFHFAFRKGERYNFLTLVSSSDQTMPGATLRWVFITLQKNTIKKKKAIKLITDLRKCLGLNQTKLAF